ncbi:nipped-B isoform X1 [Pelobates cultripes]|uniref:Nipped-B isoform X1 n=1 Tax=Pelobates cultripes TaxID=61616 RepID=A0AAD1SDC2_PELCU|nr:nipped-B isoform X1 [Pelobates cultripes]
MNGDMPHVPITTLAGIASLTDLLNQLPLPSPLPATTTKSLLFNGRIAEEVNCLLACRDEPLVSQLVHSLNQVSTDHIELKDNLGSDDPEGDIPVLLQATLARNPNVFREKSMQNRYGVQSGMMMPQYKLPQNSMHGSPASSNYQQTTTISHSPSSRFVPPQTSSTNRFIGQQNSPVPSPYAPQSPAGYMPYAHPGSYTQHQQMQQASVSSPIVAGGLRNLHENKVSGQLSGNAANHHADNSRHSTSDDYLQMVHRLGSEDSDSSIRNPASFSLRSPQSVCSPAGSEGTPKGSRPLILPTPPSYASPRDAHPDILLDSPDRKQKKQKKLKLSKDEKEQSEKSAMYDIISSPSKDSTKLTLRLSRVRSSEMDQQGDLLPSMEDSNVSEGDSSFNIQYPGHTSKTPITPHDISRPLNAAACFQEQADFLHVQQVPVLQPNTSAAAKPPQPPVAQSQPQQTGSITPYDEVELDALAEIERIERESAIERERSSKEVQDKDKPLKKRRQDSYPLEAGGATGGNKPASQETDTAGNGSRPALMVSIDLLHAGRGDTQASVTQDSDFVRKPEDTKHCNDGYVSGTQEDTLGVLKHNPENNPGTPRNVSDLEAENPDKLIKSTPTKFPAEILQEELQNETKPSIIKAEPPETNEEQMVSEDSKMDTKPESCELSCEDTKVENMCVGEDVKTENQVSETTNDDKPCDDGDPAENTNLSDSSMDTTEELRKRSTPSKQRTEEPRQKSEGKPDTPKQKSEGKPDASKQKSEGRPETPKQKSDGKSDMPKQKTEGKSDTTKQKSDGQPETPRQRNDGRPETPKHKNDNRPETPKHKSESKPETPKQKNESRSDTLKQKSDSKQESHRQKSDEHSEASKQKVDTPKHKHDNRRDSVRLSSDKKPDISKHKTDSKCESSKTKSESRSDGGKPKVDGRPGHESSRRDHENTKQKSDDKADLDRQKGDQLRVRRPESLRSFNKSEQEAKHGVNKSDPSKVDKSERKHRHDSDDSRDRLSSGEQKLRSSSPRIKGDSKSDSSKSDSSKPKSDKPVLRSPSGKDEKRTDGNKSKVDGNKANSDNKTGFPSYLLGGSQGALKHFVIPKLKRDKDGNVTQDPKRSELKGDQKEKSGKIGLVEDLNKGAKPVVVLQKLSLDEVQKLIKEREDKSRSSLKSNKNRPSKSSKGVHPSPCIRRKSQRSFCQSKFVCEVITTEIPSSLPLTVGSSGRMSDRCVRISPSVVVGQGITLVWRRGRGEESHNPAAILIEALFAVDRRGT